MFFMIGITEGRKDLEYSRAMLCRACGRYGNYQVFMTFTTLLLFFIPCLRWNRKYFVQASCCGALYELDPDKGKAIARGEAVDITDSDLTAVWGQRYAASRRVCRNCGYVTEEDFRYCPKCGREF